MSDIYQPPQSILAEVNEQVGDFGSIERGLNGDFEFSIGRVLSEAWELTRGSKGHIVGAMAIVWLLSMAVNFSTMIPAMKAGADGQPPPSPGALVITLQYLVMFLTQPITAGTMLYGIRRASNVEVSFGTIFSCYNKLFPIIGLIILQWILAMLGYLCLVVPGVYLSIAYMLALPLLVERDLGIWESLEISRKALTHCWFKFFGLLIMMGVTILISVIPAGVGLIWTFPMGVMVIGVVYREVFGIGGA